MDEKIGVYNPTLEDFWCQYDVDGNRSPKNFIVPARDIAYFAPRIADHVKNHLADAILHKRGLTGVDGVKHSPHDIKKEILEEISV